MSLVVSTFYKFVQLPDFAEQKSPLLAYCQQQEIKGTILLASEGINGTITGDRTGVNRVLAWLRSDSRLADLESKESPTESLPFRRMKVLLKSEIVTIGLPKINPSQQVGKYISPEAWNDLIQDPDVLVVDTRNIYEVKIGTFKGAQNPKTKSFREFPDFVRNHLNPQKHQKVALFCTGGIRCEKATSYMLSQGFEEVYHLQGGILKYLETVPPEESLWQGECFVFDQRVAVKQGLATGTYEMCLACGQPISEEDKTAPQYREGISCPHCFDNLTEAKKARQETRQQQRSR